MLTEMEDTRIWRDRVLLRHATNTLSSPIPETQRRESCRSDGPWRKMLKILFEMQPVAANWTHSVCYGFNCIPPGEGRFTGEWHCRGRRDHIIKGTRWCKVHRLSYVDYILRTHRTSALTEMKDV